MKPKFGKLLVYAVAHVREHAMADRPHTSLWLAKTYVIPAGMYGSQVWGTVFLQAGREFSSLLSMLHLHF